MIQRHNLRINGARLWDSLMEMAKIGGTPKGGCNRQALTGEDAIGRALFRTWCEKEGCTLKVDRLGTMFARREGMEDLPPILIGSHLDTQPTGGKFDGVLGVLAGLELIRCLNEAGIRTRRPIEIVNWTNEEGCRFAPAMLASAVFAGLLDEKIALDTRDAAGFRLGDELDKHGQNGDEPVGGRKIGAYLELHIEQGPILEAGGYDIGFVTSGQGLRWYDAIFRGFESHAGPTPMPVRRDALLGAAHFIQKINEIGLAFPPSAVSTVGEMQVMPNSRNVIPGEVKLSVDIRHPEAETLAAMDAKVRQAFAETLVASRLEGELMDISHSPAVPFDKDILGIIRAETAALGFTGRDIVSGAGHDAVHIAKIVPSAMIFTPCKDGVSHNEAEDILPEWAEAGANVLLRTALTLANRP
ncbi:MAG: Zn-dependent hydrolase [Rhizobiales bacterium PAR1]|nr:MAG: Zn-dependent hydrolase [Rhizobiales bacterium PAR1]